jgi:PPM family protein phosphatase
MRNVVLNSVGGGNAEVKPEVHKHHLEPDDVLLLCTDGLTGMIPDPELASILAEDAAPDVTCQALVDESNRRGGKDNITVVVARFAEAATHD